MRHTPITRKRTPSPVKPHRARSGWLWTAVAGLLVLLGGGLIFHGSPFGSQPPTPAATCPAGNLTATYVTGNAGERHLPAQRIDTIQVGQRLVGRNPIREQVESVEPDPATWRKISLYMTKESGLGLWIDLLRPLSWIDDRGATVGGSVYVEMPDMGAVGDAQVTHIGPCPPIEPGDGGVVVTGTFKHQADASNKVVHLQLEDQSEPTGVTDNHPYWSVDRREFVPVGQLRPGELVDTIYGPKHVLSITPIAHNGFVYNVETTEHVYRVGELGTLVHNDCEAYAKHVMRRLKRGTIAKVVRRDGGWLGTLPKYPVPIKQHGMGDAVGAQHHFIHLVKGVLRDPAHRKGTPLTEWLKEFAQLNNTPVDKVLKEINFLDSAGKEITILGF